MDEGKKKSSAGLVGRREALLLLREGKQCTSGGFYEDSGRGNFLCFINLILNTVQML